MPEPRQRLYRVACAAMFVFGIVLALPGTILGLPDAVDRFDLSLADRGALISSLFVGLLAGSFLSGPLIDRISHRASLAGSAALVAVCLPLFALAPGYAAALAALAAVGLASAGINTASNALSSDLFPDERGRRMNGIAIAVGVGGLSLPAATALSSPLVPWTGIVFGAAALAAMVMLAALRMPQMAPHVHRDRGVPLLAVMRQQGLPWFAVLIMLAAGTEASMAGFTSTYLAANGFSPSAATLALSSHWVGLIAGRMSLGGLVDRGKAAAVVAAAVGGAATALLFVTATRPSVLAAAPFLIGVAIAIIMPTSLALAGERYPRSAGTLFGLLLTVAQVGAMLLPAAIGVTADASGLRAGLALLVGNNLLVAATCLKASRAARR